MTVAYRPRYKAVSVTGWAIKPERMSTARNASKATPSEFWYVLDRADCHRVVAAFDWSENDKRGKAETLAAELNADDEARLAEAGLT